MKDGQVFGPVNLVSFIDDFEGTVTVGNSQNLVPCHKCEKCGHTVTKGKEDTKHNEQ